MMAEARDGKDKEGPHREVQDQTAEHLGITKLQRLPSRSLSSIRAVIKRTRTNSQSDKERRRSEITIISAEPLNNNNWFSASSAVFSPSQSKWSTDTRANSEPPPSYDQVIEDKRQEEHIRPIAAPRRTPTTATSATQTEFVGKGVSCGATPPERRTYSKKPQKPPRPYLLKGADRKLTVRHDENKNIWTLVNTDHQSYLESDSEQLVYPDPSHTFTRSVTVHWDISTNCCDATGIPAQIKPSKPENNQRPIPLPRTKIPKQIRKESHVHTLVTSCENSNNIHSDSQEFIENSYLEEFREISSEGNRFWENSYTVDLIHKQSLVEDVLDKMNSNNQQNILARIQAFESQAEGEEGNLPRQLPITRRSTTRPPVAAKPLAALRSQSINDNNQNFPLRQSFQPLPPPKKPVGFSVREGLESLHSANFLSPNSCSSALAKEENIYEVEPSPTLPIFKENLSKLPLKPSLNMNNHNSTSLVTENQYVEKSINKIIKPHLNADTAKQSLPSLPKRPTTIRVPSKTCLDNFQEDFPPLPVQKAAASLNHAVGLKDSFQNLSSSQPSLPPRNSTLKKTLPPRPTPGKAGPVKPPPPSRQSGSGCQGASWKPSPKDKAKNSPRNGKTLPPRPSPGHRLYNKYILELPHGIATFDYNGSNTGELSFQKNEVLLLLEEINHKEFECQVGERRGRVHKSRITVITPLELETSSLEGAASGGDANGLTVQALHDFSKENPDELSLKAGDVVTMVEQVDSQWYKGTCRGFTGFFPINYVKVCSSSPKPLPERKPKKQSASLSGPRCAAKYNFEAEHSDELSFCEGDVIQLKEYVGEDWAHGQLGTAVGIFPLNLVEIIEDLPPSQSAQTSNKATSPGVNTAPLNSQFEAAKPTQCDVEWVVALYDYTGESKDNLSFQQGDNILITQHFNDGWSCGRLDGKEGIFPTAYVESKSGKEQSENHQNGATSSERAKALFNFTSDTEEELSFKVGDIITNMESVDEEWFLGNLRGKRALVPKNYVQVLQ